MDTMIALLAVLNVTLFICLIVVSMARMDRRYAARVRAEYDRKSVLRDSRRDDDQF